MKKIINYLKLLQYWFVYKSYKRDEQIAYLSAQLKGCYCEEVRFVGSQIITKYDPTRLPQEKPEIMTYKEFKKMFFEDGEFKL